MSTVATASGSGAQGPGRHRAVYRPTTATGTPRRSAGRPMRRSGRHRQRPTQPACCRRSSAKPCSSPPVPRSRRSRNGSPRVDRDDDGPLRHLLHDVEIAAGTRDSPMNRAAPCGRSMPRVAAFCGSLGAPAVVLWERQGADDLRASEPAGCSVFVTGSAVRTLLPALSTPVGKGSQDPQH